MMYGSITPPEWYRKVIFGGPGPWIKETEEKENQTKYRGLSVKSWSHVRILRYLTWVAGNLLDYEQDLWHGDSIQVTSCACSVA